MKLELTKYGYVLHQIHNDTGYHCYYQGKYLGHFAYKKDAESHFKKLQSGQQLSIPLEIKAEYEINK